MGMATILINSPWPLEQISNLLLTEGSTWSLKKIDPGVTEEKSFKCVNGRTMDGWQQTELITIAHPEPCSGELKNTTKKMQIKNMLHNHFWPRQAGPTLFVYAPLS